MPRPPLLFLDFGGDVDINRALDAHRRGALHRVRIDRPLRALAHASGNLDAVTNPDARNAHDAVDIFDVAFDLAPDLVGMIRNLADCQGP